MGHDQLFKAVLQSHLRDFLELFYPGVAERLDFRTLRLLDKELFTDLPKGSAREADVVAEVTTHEGEPELVLIHIEIQVRPERDFERRMFEYYASLWLRHRVPIFPVALYLTGGREALEEEEYRVALFGREQLRFRYGVVRVAQLEAGEYVERSPLAAALAALMKNSGRPEPAQLRASMMRRVVESDLDEARKFLLFNVIETYSKLHGAQAEAYRSLLSRKEYRKVEELELTWADEKELEGQHKLFLRLLAKKFGPLPDAVKERVKSLRTDDDVDVYLDRLLTAISLEEMGLS